MSVPLSFESVSVTFPDGTAALDSVELAIGRGEFVERLVICKFRHANLTTSAFNILVGNPTDRWISFSHFLSNKCLARSFGIHPGSIDREPPPPIT